MNFTWNFLTRIPREFFFVQDHVKWYENYFRRIPRHLKVSVFFLKIWISCETQFPVFLIEYNCWTVEWWYKWCYYSYTCTWQLPQGVSSRRTLDYQRERQRPPWKVPRMWTLPWTFGGPRVGSTLADCSEGGSADRMWISLQPWPMVFICI